jgi:hypothetical protein
MGEIIIIILRVIYGVLPVLWLFSWIMFSKKNKLEKLSAVLTAIVLGIGLIDCLLTAFGI